MIQRQDHAFLHHFLNHVLTGNRDIIRCATLTDFSHHGLIGIEGLVDDLVACLSFKFLEQFWVDIIAPVIEVNNFVTSIAFCMFQLIANTEEDSTNSQNR